MNRLLKLDFYRLKKDVTTLIGVLVCFGLLLLTIGIQGFGYFMLKSTGLEDSGLAIMFLPRSTYIQNFQIANNSGLVVLIITLIFTVRDFSQNTMRLKIINGFKKRDIYLSSLITTLVYGVPIIFAFSFISFVAGLLFFGYVVPFDTNEFLKLLATSALLILYLILFLSIINAISMRFQKVGPAIGITIAVVLGENLVSTSISLIPTLGQNLPEWPLKFLNLLPTYALTTLVGFSFDGWDLLIMLIGFVGLTVLVNLLGIKAFEKKDIN